MIECEQCGSEDRVCRRKHPGHPKEQTPPLCWECYDEMTDYYDYMFEDFGKRLQNE